MNRCLSACAVVTLLSLGWMPAQAADPPRDASGARLSGASPGKRVALILANARYQHIRKLDNPENDAVLMENTLKELGFKIVGGKAQGANLAAPDMSEQIDRFADEARGAELSVVYYAGHGLVRPGEAEQYLVGVEYDGNLAKLPKQGIGLSEVMERLSLLDSRNNLVFLDACRTIGRGQGGMRGSLAFKADPLNTLVLFATAADDIASDGVGRNSPFTEALAQELTRKGAEWHDIQLAVINKVQQKTQGQQEPRVYGGLKERIYLTGQIKLEPGPGEIERDYWASIKDSTDPADFEAYLEQYPKGQFRKLAENRLKRLRAQAVVQAPPPPPVVVTPPPRPAEPVPATVVRPQAETPRPSPVATRSTLPPVENIDGWSTERVQALQRQTAAALGRSVEGKACAECTTMSLIPAGRYSMGSPEGEEGHDSSEGPQHEVRVPAFEMGKYEVTQGQWKEVMGSNMASFEACGDDCPVEKVSWNDIQVFIQKLNARTGQSYRLPSEAEWEYAARSGTTTRYNTGDCITLNQANIIGNEPADGCQWNEFYKAPRFWVKTKKIGSYDANAWGLHDVHGNVREWVQDCRGDYLGASRDGSARESACYQNERVVRGGYWNHIPKVSAPLPAIPTRPTGGTYTLVSV